MIIEHKFRGADLNEVVLEADLEASIRNVIVTLTARYHGRWRNRGGFLSYEFRDDSEFLLLPNPPFLHSAAAGTFFYLNLQETDQKFLQGTAEVLEVPPGAQKLIIRGVNWSNQMQIETHDLQLALLSEEGLKQKLEQQLPQWTRSKIPDIYRQPWSRRKTDRAALEPGNSQTQKEWATAKEILGKPRSLEMARTAYMPQKLPAAHKIKVALICDEFTFNSFSPEFDYVILNPDNWRESMEEHEPDLFLCESAWSGTDSVKRLWRGQIYASAKFRTENRQTLLSIISYCQAKSIPSVFWNKEDPTHFFDRVNDFVSTAAKFDYVLTTAEEMVPEYQKFMPKDSVGVLQFAVQPRDFNPLGNTQRRDTAVFAGAWYDVHPARSKAMAQGFDWVIKQGVPLEIYDRNKTSAHKESDFPSLYREFVHPAVTHRSTAKLYRERKFGLNFNTVTDSSTMFARRVFELAASGCLIVSNHSPGIEKIFGDSAVYFDRSPRRLQDLDVSQMTMDALRHVLTAHTYRHRFEEILNHLSIRHASARPRPTMLVTVRNSAEAQRAIQNYFIHEEEYSRLLIAVDDSVPSEQTSKFVTDHSGPAVDVISTELLRREKVPSTNILMTPDVVIATPDTAPSGLRLESVMMHGEYTRLPVAINEIGGYRMTAGPIGPGMRVAATDVVDVLTNPDEVRVMLEVNE